MGHAAELLTNRQRQTLPARRALAAKFVTEEQKSEHFRSLAQKSHERRSTLSGDEAAALVGAYELLARIGERGRKKGVGPDEAGWRAKAAGRLWRLATRGDRKEINTDEYRTTQ